MPSDRQLLELFTDRRDVAAELAFAELVRRHGPMVLGVCRQLLNDPHEAEDAFQVTFLVLARRASSIGRPELLGHWLYGVAVRTARKAKALARRRRRHEGREEMMITAEPIGDEGRHDLRLSRREQAEVLHEELGHLPEKYRVPVVLCYLEGLTHPEAAERLRCPLGTLSVRLMRARELLRSRLTRRGLAPTFALLATAALPETAPSVVPAALAEDTVRAAFQYACGRELTAGVVSESVSTLTANVLAATIPTSLASALTALSGGLVALMVCLLSLESRPWGDSRDGRRDGRIAVARPSPPARDDDRQNSSRGAETVERDDGVQAVGPDDAPRRISRQDTIAGSSPLAPPADVLTTYLALVGRSGRDADAQVRLALWCESNGLEPERLKHLVRAILNDPDHTKARGLLGQLTFRGRWRRPEDLGDLIRGDTQFGAALAEYNIRRERMENDADAHWRLALWCEQKGLKPESLAHFTAVTRREPTREAAWKRLGYREHRGRWMRPVQIAAETSALEAQRKGDRYWKPLLSKWRSALRDNARREWAEAKLSGVTDPRAVPAIWATFATGGPEDQAIASRLLRQIDGPAASRSLALLAVSGDSAEVRREATETLARRDPRDVVGLLISLLIDPIRYETRPVRGPGASGILLVEGEPFNVRRLYTVPPLPEDTIRRLIDPTTPPAWLGRQLGDDFARLVTMSTAGIVLRRNIVGVEVNLFRAATATVFAQLQMINDIDMIEAYNRSVIEANRRVESPLHAITGQDHGTNREAWRAWWTDQQGYTYEPPRSRPKPTIDQGIPLVYNPAYNMPMGMSCFGAGTLVRTREGVQPIESIRVGDIVLTQDTETGSLGLAPVLAVFHNKPAPTLRIELGGESIVVTGIHRFWKAGRGWTMARDLKPGDAVRTLGGLARVSSVSPDRVQPVFNLEVGECQSFFAGPTEALVHDNSLVQPAPRPFDEVPDLTERAMNDDVY